METATYSTARVVPRTQDAWTAFWQDPAQSHCVADAPEIQRELATHWSRFAAIVPADTRVLDLGCGAGAVARALLTSRRDLHVTGIDFARVPLMLSPQVELLSETPMESLPFAGRSFGAVVSQFGFEYGNAGYAVREMARVLAPGAPLSFLVHHAESAIVSGNRARLNALMAFLSPMMREAFCGADTVGFHAQMSALIRAHPDDTLVVELARSLPSRLSRTARERVTIWRAIEDALAPERCIAESLNSCCVAPDELDSWLQPLQAACSLQEAIVLREPGGTPIAWRIEGLRTAG